MYGSYGRMSTRAGCLILDIHVAGFPLTHTRNAEVGFSCSVYLARHNRQGPEDFAVRVSRAINQ